MKCDAKINEVSNPNNWDKYKWIKLTDQANNQIKFCLSSFPCVLVPCVHCSCCLTTPAVLSSVSLCQMTGKSLFWGMGYQSVWLHSPAKAHLERHRHVRTSAQREGACAPAVTGGVKRSRYRTSRADCRNSRLTAATPPTRSSCSAAQKDCTSQLSWSPRNWSSAGMRTTRRWTSWCSMVPWKSYSLDQDSLVKGFGVFTWTPPLGETFIWTSCTTPLGSAFTLTTLSSLNWPLIAFWLQSQTMSPMATFLSAVCHSLRANRFGPASKIHK